MNLRRVLWHLLGGTRGGPLRLRLITHLRERPYNTNQLSVLLGVDYKTVQHHVRVLAENRILTTQGGYGALHFLTKDMGESLPELERIAARLAATAPRRDPDG